MLLNYIFLIIKFRFKFLEIWEKISNDLPFKLNNCFVTHSNDRIIPNLFEEHLSYSFLYSEAWYWLDPKRTKNQRLLIIPCPFLWNQLLKLVRMINEFCDEPRKNSIEKRCKDSEENDDRQLQLFWLILLITTKEDFYFGVGYQINLFSLD